MGSLSQRVALVTGGATGIGLGIARRLRNDGVTVVITDVDAATGMEASRQHDLTFLEQNVCDEARWAAVIADCERRFGKLNILVNNAGVIGPMDLANPVTTSLETWRRVFAVNLDGVFLGCRAAIPAMARAGGGVIVNISSVSGLLATPFATAYGASKAAVRQLTKSVAQYCAQSQLNIRCNSVHPGNVRTPMWDRHAEELATTRGVSKEKVIGEIEGRTPLGSMTRPEDVAAVVSFLASDDARNITGTKFIVDGGLKGCDTFLLVPKTH